MRTFEWISRVETINAIIHTEFVRNWLLPVASTVVTGTSGIFGGTPLIWTLVGSSVVFMTTSLGMLGHVAIKEKNTPQNKLLYKPIVNRDMTPREAPPVGNRHQRLAQKAQHHEQTLSSSQVMFGVNRTLDAIQVGVELTNTALFPISCILVSADTEIEGEKPPRSNFPKAPAICPPGNTIRMTDDSIPMEEFPCQRLTGKIDMIVKYGMPQNEMFELHIKGGLDIQMESSGIVNMVAINL
jgi:hypothetical protein